MDGQRGPGDRENLLRAQAEAVELARRRLQDTDLAHAARLGGLGVRPDGNVDLEFLGRPMRVDAQSLAVHADDGKPVHRIEELLVLRYLLAGREIRPAGELISFRNFPGGVFYLEPILKRTSQVVLKTFGNDIDRLRSALGHFAHSALDLGDLSAQVHAIGRIDITLVYRLGDDEFPPTFDILFDRVAALVYNIDEAAALAHRLCIALARQG